MSTVLDPAQRARVAEVRRWASELLGGAGPVLVTELRCTKPECPTVETVIALLSTSAGAQRRWTLPAPVAALTREAVAAALAGPGQGQGHGDDAP